MARPGPVRAFDDVVVVEHHYPTAFELLREQGPHAVAVMHVLLTRASVHEGALVSTASVRDIAAHLECLSKDSVHRGLRALVRAHIIKPSATAPSTYRVYLNDRGITVRRSDTPF